MKTYVTGIGRRKEAVARVYLKENGDVKFTVNGSALNEYFPVPRLQAIVQAPLKVAEVKNVNVKIRVSGGGIRGQAEAVQLGLARALEKKDSRLRPILKKQGFLKRDPRVKERKKYGRKRARRGFQWTKR